MLEKIASQKHIGNKSEFIRQLFDVYSNIHKANNEIRSLILKSSRSVLNSSDDMLLKRIEGIVSGKWMNYQWINASMKMHIENNEHSTALSIFGNYKDKVRLNDVSCIYALKSCANINDYKSGQSIIRDLRDCSNIKLGVEFSNCLIHFYGHFGRVRNALNVFESIKHKDIVTINSMMKMFVDNGLHSDAVALYHNTGKSMTNDVTHVLMLKACSNPNGYDEGIRIIKDEQLKSVRNIRLQNTLIHFYGTHSRMHEAIDVFNRIHERDKNIQSINALMTAYFDNRLYQEAVQILRDLIDKYDFKPNTVTHIIGIKSYSNIGDIASAKQLFDEIKSKTSESVNCMMQAYIEHNMGKDALSVYTKYDKLHSQVSHLLAIKTCTSMSDVERGKQIISTINTNSFCDINLQNVMIDFYGNCGDVTEAWNVYNSMKEKDRNIGTVNSMMTVYLENKCYAECIDLFNNAFARSRLQPNVISYAVALKACTKGTIFHFGQNIHDKLLSDKKNCEIFNHPSIQINLIYMYGKCGKLDICAKLFGEYKDTKYEEFCKNKDIWNAMIHSYGRNGDIERAMNIFNRMKTETQLEIDYKIYTTLINACNHSGKVEQALALWRNEVTLKSNDIKCNKYTVSAFIDCLSRTGHLKVGHKILLEYEDAVGIVEDPNDGQWMALLNGCKKSGDVEFGEIIFKEFQKRYAEKWPSHMASASVVMSNIHAKNDAPAPGPGH